MKYADSNVKNACASLAMVLVALISSLIGWESGSVFLFIGVAVSQVYNVPVRSKLIELIFLSSALLMW